MTASTFRDWQQSFCPFDAVGTVRPNPSAPKQADFAKSVRVARFVTDPARVSAAGSQASALPYTREQVDQAVDYFTQGQHAEILDKVVWEWAYNEYLVFQQEGQYTRTWAPERLRWEHVVLTEPTVVDLHSDNLSASTGDRDELGEHTREDGMTFEDDTTLVHSLPRRNGRDGNPTTYDKSHRSNIPATEPVFDPLDPAHMMSMRTRRPRLILQPRTALNLGGQASPVLGVSPRRSQSQPPQRDIDMRNVDSDNGSEDEDEEEDYDIQYATDARTRFTRQSSVPSPVKGDVTPLDIKKRSKKGRGHQRVHKTGIVLGFHRRQLQKLSQAQMAGPASPTGNDDGQDREQSTRPGQDHRQVVHGVVDAPGRVQRWLRPENMAGKLVPEQYRLKGVSGIDGESIAYLAHFKGMSHEAINDGVVRLTVEAREKERFGGMGRSV